MTPEEALAVSCPRCFAPEGKRCIAINGLKTVELTNSVHYQRIRQAERAEAAKEKK